MNPKNKAEIKRYNLRSLLKSLLMGDYIDLILKASPLNNEINNVGQKLALTNCNIFDGLLPELKNNMTLLMVGDKIFDIGPCEKITIPNDFYIIDIEGQTLLPGFIDSHVHECSPFTYNANASAIRQMPLQVALNNMRTVYSGVTTVCDMGGPQGIIKEFTKLAEENLIPGPRFLNCYTLISPKKGKNLGYPTQVSELNFFQSWLLEGQVATRPKNIKALQKACYKIRDDGGTHLKMTYQPHPFSKKKHNSPDNFPVFDDDWIKAIFRIGKETGLVVDIHAPYGDGAEKCVDLAIEVGSRIRIQHITFDRDINDSMIHKMQDNGFYMIPTVMVFGDSFHLPEFVSWLENDPKDFMMPEPAIQSKTRINKWIDLEPYSGHNILEIDYAYFRENFDYVKRNTQKAHDAGLIGFGTDMGGTDTGFFGRLYAEIMHYVDFGISTFDILKYLTSFNAEINDLKDRGIIRKGKLADLIVVDGNPLNDINVLHEISTVIKGGVFLKYKDLELTTRLTDSKGIINE